jgi:ABC-type transport system substrate-binding protein
VSPGTTIAGYRVLSAVGEGAMGAVLLAEHEVSGERVALKLLDPELARDDRFRARFLRESQVAAGLDHPNIIQVFESGEADGFLYLAMAYVEGTDLRELLRHDVRLEPERAIDLVGDVAAALDAAHAAGLIHRDVKPANILVARDGEHERAVVCDFGLARHLSSAASLTSDRTFVGTIDYVPPEQIEGGTIDGRADVYSLGCVLYECLSGERPYERESELSVVFAHLNEPPPALSAVRLELASFDWVFATALAKAPDERFDTCGELVEAGRAALRGETPGRRRRSRSRALLIGAAAAVVALAGLAAFLFTGGDGKPAAGASRIPLQGNRLNLLDTASKRVLATVRLPGGVSLANGGIDVTAGRRSAWVLLVGKQELLRVGLGTHRIEGTTRLPWIPAGRIVAGGGLVWASQDGGPGVVGIDMRTGRIARRFSIDGGNAVGIAFGAGSLWLAQGTDVARMDPRDGNVIARIAQRPGQVGEIQWLVFSRGYLWGAGPNGYVRKYDPGANQIVAQTHISGWIGDLAVGRDVWVSSTLEGVVYDLNLDDLSPSGTAPAGIGPERLSLGGGRVWVASPGDLTLSTIDVPTGRLHRLPSAARAETAFYSNGLLLTAAEATPPPLTPVSGQEIRISIPQSPLHFDPATPQTGLDAALRYATCANLLTYPDEKGPAGGALRPEVAAALPIVSADGLTYTFRIRRGFRFSPPSNEPVTAATFKFSIERALSPRLRGFGGSSVWYIAGQAAYESHRAKHISGIVARGDTLRITLARAEGAFPTGLSTPQFCPVPIGTPIRPNAVTRPLPSDGPYYVSSDATTRTVLLRNPNYAGTRLHRAQRIVFSYGQPTQQALALANEGDVDYLPPGFGASGLVDLHGPLDRTYGPGSAAARAGDARFIHSPEPGVDELVLNASRPLFHSVRMRRAVAYALDRRALANAFNDVPADGIVPAAVPGFGTAHMYPLEHPDLAAARRLAGGGRHHAVLYFCTNGVFGGTNQRAVAVLIRAQLARIGVDVAVTSPPCGPEQAYDANAKHADLIMVSQYSTLRDPEQYLEQVLRPRLNGGALGRGIWSRPDFRSRVLHARRLGGSARRRAYLRIEQDILHAAPIVPYGSFYSGEYFARGVGCKVVPPGIGVIDLAALCKRP